MIRLLLGFTRHTARATKAVAHLQFAGQMLAGLLALSLGFWGWTIKMPPTDAAGWFNNAFRTIQLITFQFPTHLESNIPWQLQVGRLAVPLVVALATFNVLIGTITRPVRLALLPHTTDHIVVCGAAQLTEAALVTLTRRGRQIVTVAAQQEATHRETLEGIGLTCVKADPQQTATFHLLNLQQASALFLTHEDDLTNLNLTMLAIAALKPRSTTLPPLVLGVLIEREDLARELDAALDDLARRNRVRYYRLSPDREGLRLELQRFAPALHKTDRDVRSHVLVMGLAGQWQQILSELILTCQDHPNQQPFITLVLDAAEAAELAGWHATRPDHDLVVEFLVIERGPGLLPELALLAPWRAAHPAPQLAVVLREDADAIATALALRRPGNPLGTEATPVLVRQETEDRLLAGLSSVGAQHQQMQDLAAFGGLIRAESIERVLDRLGDDMAIALHAHYLRNTGTSEAKAAAALNAWDDLPENLRDANRTAAMHTPILLASAGFRIIPAVAGVPEAVITDDELECLARVEHRRWCAERIERGWRSGPQRDYRLLIHSSLVLFDDLEKTEQIKDRNAVLAVIETLRSTGRLVIKAGHA